MDKDLDNSLVLFRDKYNEERNSTTIRGKKVYPTLLEDMEDTFSSASVMAKAKQLGIKTSSRVIICRWIIDKLIKKESKDKWPKI